MFFSQKHVLVVYGDTPLLEGMMQTLRMSSSLTLRSLSLMSDIAALTALRPDLILVDASQINSSQIKTLILAFPSNPTPPILALDSNTQRLTVLSAQQYPVSSFDELVRILETTL